MHWSDIPLHPSPRTLRRFACLWILFFGGLSCWQGLHAGNETASLILGAIALSVGPLGLLAPRLLGPIFVAWMVLAFPFGWVVSRVLLAVVFYGVFTPVWLWFRLIGRDALSLRRPERESYWTPKPAASGVREYFRQS